MRVRDICRTAVATIEPDATLQEATWAMREDHVGDLIVVESGDDGDVPCGILTDRDIVIDVLAEGATDLESVRVEDEMTEDLITVHLDDAPGDAIDVMQAHGVRRLPVLDDGGALYGIVTLDDMLTYLTRQMAGLSGVVSTEIRKELEQDM